jgi:hypothetical protein
MESDDPKAGRDLCKDYRGIRYGERELDFLNLPSSSFLGNKCADTAECAGKCRRDRRLHPNFDRFKGAEGNIGNELSRGTSGQIQNRSILVGGFLSDRLGIEMFEELVTAVLESSLGLKAVSVATRKYTR